MHKYLFVKTTFYFVLFRTFRKAINIPIFFVFSHNWISSSFCLWFLSATNLLKTARKKKRERLSSFLTDKEHEGDCWIEHLKHTLNWRYLRHTHAQKERDWSSGECWVTSSLPLLSGSLLPGDVVPVRVTCIDIAIKAR